MEKIIEILEANGLDHVIAMVQAFGDDRESDGYERGRTDGYEYGYECGYENGFDTGRELDE